MTRKKVKLAFICNDASRKAAFRERKKGLLKKVRELSTLYGVEARAIIYSPFDSQPHVWPSTLGVQNVLPQFEMMPELHQSKRMMDQESFLQQRLAKAKEYLKKLRRDNQEKEVTQLLFQILKGKRTRALNLVDLNDLGWIINQYLTNINQKLDSLNNTGRSHIPVPLTAVPAEAVTGSEENVQAQAAPISRVNMAMQRPPLGVNSSNPLQSNGFFA